MNTLLYLPLLVLLLLSCTLVAQGQAVDLSFLQGSSFTEFNEEQPIGSVIIDLEATYVHSGIIRDETTGSYQITSGNSESYFTLNTANGQLSNAVLLDRETLNSTQFALTITFTSSLDPSLTGSVDVQLNLLDINDNSPHFTHALYEIAIPEGTPIGASFYQVNASDPDAVQRQLIIDEDAEDFGGFIYLISNGRVIYSIINGNEDNRFALHSDNGSLVIHAQLDVDIRDFYNLTILAVDGGGLNDTTTLLITVLDSNDNAPVILTPGSFNVTFIEDISPGLILIDSINATDDDYGLNALIDFSILNGDITNSFSINSTTGQLTMIAPLDRESGNPIVLIIAATDNGIPPLYDTITVTITLLDVNDNGPNFTLSMYQFNIEEGSLIGSLIGTVIAIDGDNQENGTVIYTLITNTSVFVLSNETGQLYTNDTLDRENISSYFLTVQAHDTPLNSSLSFTSTASIVVTVTDRNDNPPIWDYPSVSVGILDTQPIGYHLITLHATDRDTGTNGDINYEFLGTHDEDFIIDASTGNVSVNRDLDFNTKPFYSYTVRAYDGGIPTMDSLLTHFNITVHTPNIRTPRFPIKEHNLTLLETEPVGTIVLNVTARDGDPGLIGDLSYRIADDYKFTDSGSFEVELKTGSVFINSTLDYDYR